MKQIKIYNKIAKVGLGEFPVGQYDVREDAEAPVGALVRSASLHEENFPKELLAIARAGAGVNNIPVEKLAEEGVVVFNTPSANANAVKELVVLGLLIASRRVVPAIEWAKTLKGEGDAVPKLVEKGKGAFVGPEIRGKTLGVIGLGAIGVLVANAALELGMKVYGYDPFLSLQNALHLCAYVEKVEDLNEIYAKCDYISLHLPLNSNTKGMVNKDALDKMRDGVRILNFARDGLVESADMLGALSDGKVASYVVDFPTEEMLGVEGVVAIPHLGASTPESEDNCAVMAVRQLVDYLENGNVTNAVNLPALSMPRSTATRFCVIHKNVPAILSEITQSFAKDKVNIENLMNKSRGEIAYTLLDVAPCDTETVREHIASMSDIIRVRVIQ